MNSFLEIVIPGVGRSLIYCFLTFITLFSKIYLLPAICIVNKISQADLCYFPRVYTHTCHNQCNTCFAQLSQVHKF